MLLLLHFVVTTYGRPLLFNSDLNIDLKIFLFNETLGHNAHN